MHIPLTTTNSVGRKDQSFSDKCFCRFMTQQNNHTIRREHKNTSANSITSQVNSKKAEEKISRVLVSVCVGSRHKGNTKLPEGL